MILTVPITLLISFLFVYLLGSFFGKKGSIFISCFSVFICFLIAVYSFFVNMIATDSVVTNIIELGSWMSILYLDISWNFLIDNLTLTMLLVILTISTCVHIYSYYYMDADPHVLKFFSYITLFTFFMCVLVTSSNFIILFFGWEGVGICSFLLISFWNTRVQANKSAMKAMLINKVGDFFILIAIILIAINFKTLDFLTIFSQVSVYSLKHFINFYGLNLSIVDTICFFLSVGAITKSAQLGFHGWLPDAMEGPTPVSALIHAATMVTAGVFLIARCSYIFEFSTLILTMLTYFGALTIVIFGLVGLYQFDIKKIIAYSTCSQLGYMVLACGLSGYNLAIFHLFTHAGSKALLFLSAGTIIHIMNNEQDIRKLNGILNMSPLISVLFIIGSLSLIGFPFLSGFFSKDAIIELSFTYYSNPVIFFLALLGVILTTLYSLKISYFIFFKENNNNKINANVLANYSFNVFNFGPLIFLSFLSIFAGYFFKNLFLGSGNNIFYGSIIVLSNLEILQVEFIPHSIKMLPFILIIIFTYIFFDFYLFYFKQNPHIYYNNYSLLLFFNKRMFFDSIINLFLVFFMHKQSYKIFYLFDKGVLEFFGPFGISKLVFNISLFFYKTFNSGHIYFLLINIIFAILSFAFLIGIFASWIF